MKGSISATIAMLLLGIFNAGIAAQQFSLRKKDTGFLFLTACIIFFVGFLRDIFTIIKNMLDAREPQPEPMPEPVKVIPADPLQSSASALQNLKIGRPCRVDGVSQYEDNILALAGKNPDYDMSENEIIDNRMVDEKIWKYTFSPQKAVLSPQKDSNTIQVLIGGKQVGYINALSSTRLLEEMQGQGVEVVYCSIGGGPYKIMYEDEMSGRHQVYERKKGYSVTLSIYEN